ncbi:MAG: peptidoglycan-associated lipoprotein [Acidobacteria bacterium]|nr:MAG: peptidoglycan-associated lipoprotein [Acidobacteriota bacterium]REK10362.1 MAG: peptidoglycan-associated lipoprotein [Acidobacteriota bacterium]
MNARRIVHLALVGLLVLSVAVACKPDPPAPPAPEVEPTPPAPRPEPTRDVTPPPPQEPEMDPRQKALSGELIGANDYAHANGLLGDVYFAFDSSALDQAARTRLAQNADFLKGDDGQAFIVTLEGHCDERGTNAYNLALGESRANAALDYLVSLGLEASRFRTQSYGEERPVCEESTESCWQRNRRAYFRLTGRR